ncbi:MAG: hypothetical protein KGL39_19335 [Patescibacteria group bacterium]|nr:hypothetical protein [Patescibacteria group bacterium]
MPLAKDVAAGLRKLAERLDEFPNLDIDKPYISLREFSDKQRFLNMARLLPRPIIKGSEYGDYYACYDSDVLRVKVSAPQQLTCTLVQPALEAVYECTSLLSPEDEDTI